MHSKYYRLADICFRLESEMELEEAQDLALFAVSQRKAHVSVRIFFAEDEQETPDCCGYARMEQEPDRITLRINRKKIPAPSDWQVFTMTPLDGILLAHDTLAFHTSFVLYQGMAILFSGPSGIGKSTQAALWENCRDAEVINGDRALIYFKNGSPWAAGYYKSGSSGVCRNETAPIAAIVLLDQGQENMVTVPRGLEAFRRIVSQCAYDPQNRRQLEQVTGLAAELLKTVKVLHFTCRKDQSAVTELEKYL